MIRHELRDGYSNDYLGSYQRMKDQKRIDYVKITEHFINDCLVPKIKDKFGDDPTKEQLETMFTVDSYDKIANDYFNRNKQGRPKYDIFGILRPQNGLLPIYFESIFYYAQKINPRAAYTMVSPYINYLQDELHKVGNQREESDKSIYEQKLQMALESKKLLEKVFE